MTRQYWNVGTTCILWKVENNLELFLITLRGKLSHMFKNVESTQTQAADILYNWIYEENLLKWQLLNLYN